jgi:hypothetical protein
MVILSFIFHMMIHMAVHYRFTFLVVAIVHICTIFCAALFTLHMSVVRAVSFTSTRFEVRAVLVRTLTLQHAGYRLMCTPRITTLVAF